jgi:hypothetical protein
MQQIGWKRKSAVALTGGYEEGERDADRLEWGLEKEIGGGARWWT